MSSLGHRNLSGHFQAGPIFCVEPVNGPDEVRSICFFCTWAPCSCSRSRLELQFFGHPWKNLGVISWNKYSILWVGLQIG